MSSMHDISIYSPKLLLQALILAFDGIANFAGCVAMAEKVYSTDKNSNQLLARCIDGNVLVVQFLMVVLSSDSMERI